MKIVIELLNRIFRKFRVKRKNNPRIYEYSSRDIKIKELIINLKDENSEEIPAIYTYFLSPLGSGHPAIAIQPFSTIKSVEFEIKLGRKWRKKSN